jgi:hypothetical protein
MALHMFPDVMNSKGKSERDIKALEEALKAA